MVRWLKILRFSPALDIYHILLDPTTIANTKETFLKDFLESLKRISLQNFLKILMNSFLGTTYIEVYKATTTTSHISLSSRVNSAILFNPFRWINTFLYEVNSIMQYLYSSLLLKHLNEFFVRSQILKFQSSKRN